jgi:hypothetical protein
MQKDLYSKNLREGKNRPGNYNVPFFSCPFFTNPALGEILQPIN